ncbi:MAG: hypothetical protein ABEJ66_00945, partial [Candidatus Nanohaloarchaea archaeon]
DFHTVLSPYPQHIFSLGGFYSKIIIFDIRALTVLVLATSGFLLFRRYIPLRDVKLRRYFALLTVLVLAAGLSSTTLFMSDWYDRRPDENVRWGRSEPAIIVAEQDGPGPKLVQFKLRSPRQRNVSLQLNGERVLDARIGGEKQAFAKALEFREGLNVLEFETGRCTVLGKVNDNQDVRCVTVGISDLKIREFTGNTVIGKNIRRKGNYFVIEKNASIFVPGGASYSLEIMGKARGGRTTVEIVTGEGEKIDSTRFGIFGMKYATPYR